MNAHLFVDESKTGNFLLVVACVVPNRLADSRKQMSRLLLGNQRRLHFSKESDARRRQIIDVIGSLEVTATVYQTAPGIAELRGRQLCIEQLGADAVAIGAARIVIESDESLVLHDRRTLYTALNGTEVAYDHLRAYEDPLLWIPDAIAWCWAKQGTWGNRVRHMVERVVVVPYKSA